jgi:hypothetical protein
MKFVCFRLKRVIQATTTIIHRHKILRYRLESNERATARGVSFVSTIGPGRTTTCVWRYLYGTTLWPLVYIQRVVQQSLTTLSTKSCVYVWWNSTGMTMPQLLFHARPCENNKTIYVAMDEYTTIVQKMQFYFYFKYFLNLA